MKKLDQLALDFTQDFFSEPMTYRRGSETLESRAVFERSWVEVNNVSSFSLTARVLTSELGEFGAPKKGDEIDRGDQTYKVLISQDEGTGEVTLVLGSK